jgi:PEP-CTERM motif
MTSHTRRVLVPLAVALMVISLPPRAARAVLVLDQVFDPGPSPTAFSGVSLGIPKAQTFTVGLAGTLARVDVDILRQDNGPLGNGPLLFDVRSTTGGGAPIENDATPLASLTIPAATIPTTFGFFSIDVSGFGIPVTPGEILAIVLRGTRTDTDYEWVGSFPNPYPAGDLYFRNASAGFPTWTLENTLDQESVDLAFKTFVAAAPAPSTLVLFGAGLTFLAGIAWKGRRRK